MTLSEAENRHAELVQQIRQHDKAYYVLAQPIISDQEYDQLFQELLDIERAFPRLVKPDSPSQRVGGEPVAAFRRVKHEVPMLSLEKLEASKTPSESEEPDPDVRSRIQDENTLKGLADFDRNVRKHIRESKVEYVLEPKVDGVSITVHYENGNLVLGATRGDGLFGDDITSNIRAIRAIPLVLTVQDPPPLLEVRGEAYMPTSEFDRLNAELTAAGKQAFPNARNATAGTLKQLDPSIVTERPIRAVFYGVGVCRGIRFSTHWETINMLKRFGLPTQPLWQCKGIDQVLRCYNEEIICGYDSSRDLRSRVPYDIDGVVIKVDKTADRARIPTKARAPGYAIVHKPIPWIMPATTVLTGITVQVGRTGVLTPVAELVPVFIQGSTISRATLHNEDEIRRKDIRIGDTVRVRKAGMVIPEVYEVVRSKRPELTAPFDLFAHVGGKCPACGGPILRDPKFVAWRCENVSGCPAQSVRRLEFMAHRSALDIEGVGGVVAEKLIEAGLVRGPLDLWTLTPDSLARLNLGSKEEPRILGEKNAQRITGALERARALPLSRWLHALGVPNVGELTSRQVASFHKDFADLAQSRVLQDVLQLTEKLQRARIESPDSVQNMPAAKRERIDLSRKLKGAQSSAAGGKREREALQNRIADLRTLESEERSRRVRQQELLNGEIERLIGSLDAAGVCTRLTRKTKKGNKSQKPAPPTIEATTEIPPEAARSILRFFDSEVGRAFLHRLRELGISPEGGASGEPGAGESGAVLSLDGKHFVLTGTLTKFSRDDAAEEIRKRGGHVGSAVTRSTDFLVVGENAGAKKSREAKALGVKELNESELLKMLDLGEKPAHTRQAELL